MINIIIYFSTGVIIGLIGYQVLFGGGKKEVGLVKKFLNRKEKKEKIDKSILELLEEKRKITNKDIENLLSVADSTATKYLQRLENEGKIKQIGNTGRGVYYIKKEK